MRRRLTLLALASLFAGAAFGREVEDALPPPRPPERPPDLRGPDLRGPELHAPDLRASETRAPLDAPLPIRRPDFAVETATEAVSPEDARAPPRGSADEQEIQRACLADLDALGVSYVPLPPIEGPGECGASLPLRVEALAGSIALVPPATTNCRTARALALWTEGALQPAARDHLDAEVSALRVSASYVCRGRNRVAGARLSEHAFANAIDIGAFEFAALDPVSIEPRGVRETPQSRFQQAIRTEACAYFRTVLGPGSDAYHDDHLHFDVRLRRNDFRFCQ